MSEIPTIKVIHKESGQEVLINVGDFNSEFFAHVTATKPVAEDPVIDTTETSEPKGKGKK